MFRTEADAWRLIRHEKLREISQTLAKIEANIKRCERMHDVGFVE
jgi:hypothetical protein